MRQDPSDDFRPNSKYDLTNQEYRSVYPSAWRPGYRTVYPAVPIIYQSTRGLIFHTPKALTGGFLL